MSDLARVERWSNFAAAGGVALGSVEVLDGSFGVALDSSDSCSFTIRHDPRVPVGLRDVLRVTDTAGTVREYRVQSRSKTLADARRTVTGLSPLADLGSSGRVRTITGGLTRYDVGAMLTSTQIIDSIVLTNLAADGLTWWSRGTIEPSKVVTLNAPAEGWTHLEWLRAIADDTGGELRARRVGETGYAIDIVTALGSTAVLAPIALGRNLLELTDSDDDSEVATAITVYGATPAGESLSAGIGENAWTIGTITGSGPFWVPLTDPAAGAGPVAFASQFGTAAGTQGAYLLTKTGTTVQITDSRISPDNAVSVAATTGLTAGDLVQIVANANATRLSELRAPNVSRLFRTDSAAEVRGERNLVRNGNLATWSSVSALANWTAQGGTLLVGEYPRTTPATATGIVLNGTITAGATSIGFRNAPAGARFFPYERFTIAGGGLANEVAAVAVADGSGVGTITLLSGTAIGHTDGAALSFFASGPIRPSPTFPSENESRALLRLCTNSTGTNAVPVATSLRLQSEAFTVKYVSGLPYLSAAIGLSVHNATASAITGVNVPALAIRNNAAGTILASVRAANIPATTTAHSVISCETLLTVDRTVDVSIWGGTAQATFVAVRYVLLWLASGSASEIPPAFGDAAFGNQLWQRGNRALLARTLVSRQIRATLRDLSSAAGYSVTREMLTLGGSITLTDLGVTVRIVAIEYNPLDPSDVRVLLDSRPTALAKYLANRVG